MSKLVTRRVKRGKHVKRMKRGKRSRCGGKHSKHKGYNKKHYTRKYGRRTRTRTKRGGGWENFDGLSYPMGGFDIVRGKGYVLVTKLNDNNEKAWNSKEDDFQIMVITQGVRNRDDGTSIIGNFHIFKCRGEGCSNRKEIVTKEFDIVYEGNGFTIKEVKFSTIPTESNPAINYRLKLVNDKNQRTLREFFYGYGIDSTNYTPNTTS